MARAIDWLRRRPAEAWVTAFLLVAGALFVFWQLQPGLLFKNTTPAGGDMGAHVYAPAYLKHTLLPHLQLSGWSPDWYDGYPIYVFYMVVPSLFIVLLNTIAFIPYNIAFKLVTVSGLVAMPFCAWGMGKLARLPYPIPTALGVATVPYIFERSFTIYGGNAASTLAGEFAFTISLCFALLFLGVVLRGLDSGKHRAAAAVLLALTVLSHLIPAIFALVAAGVALLFMFDWQRLRHTFLMLAAAGGAGVVLLLAAKASLTLAILLAVIALVVAALAGERRRAVMDALGGDGRRGWWFLSSVGLGAMISAFWTLPFVVDKRYMTDMGWEKLTTYLQVLFPGPVGDRLSHIWNGVSTVFGGTSHPVAHSVTNGGDMTYVIGLAAMGVATSFAFRRRFGMWLTASSGALAFLVLFAPQGRLWNARILPFWYLFLYFLAALAVVEIIGALSVVLSRDRVTPRRGVLLGGPLVATMVTSVIVALPLRALPFGRTSSDRSTYSWMGVSTRDQSFIPSWAKWNYSGYEDKQYYPEYRDLVAAMQGVGDKYGCGRAFWEYDKDLDRFGTPMALMLLPYWTDSCIGSQEGLYFEASATTPYHFINQSELSAGPSRAERDLPYGDLDVQLGVNHLQLLGVKYYMAFSPQAIEQADKDPDLKLVGNVPKCSDPALTKCVAWRIYIVANAEIVQPLQNEPVVVSGMKAGGKTWQKMAMDWYLDRSRWPVMRADDGPKPWQRIKPGDTPAARPYSSTAVSRIEVTKQTIKFQVDRTGAPVLVKASYFPNWKAKNAEGPYRVAPNLMVVVPKDNLVTLSYQRRMFPDWFGIAISLLGLALAWRLRRRRGLRIPPRQPRVRKPKVAEAPPLSDDIYATVGVSTDDRERWGPPPA